MRARCKKSNAKGLDLTMVTILTRDEFDFGLEIGKEYIIMGIKVRKDSNCLYYLVDEGGWPNWVPYMLFEVTDNRIPDDWRINFLDKKYPYGSIFYLMGFNELITQENFHDLLIERDEDTTRIYFRRKIEYENKLKDEELLK